MAEQCEVQYERHPTQPHLIAICTRPKGHDGEHSNVLHKPGADPDRRCPVCQRPTTGGWCRPCIDAERLEDDE